MCNFLRTRITLDIQLVVRLIEPYITLNGTLIESSPTPLLLHISRCTALCVEVSRAQMSIQKFKDKSIEPFSRRVQFKSTNSFCKSGTSGRLLPLEISNVSGEKLMPKIGLDHNTFSYLKTKAEVIVSFLYPPLNFNPFSYSLLLLECFWSYVFDRK